MTFQVALLLVLAAAMMVAGVVLEREQPGVHPYAAVLLILAGVLVVSFLVDAR